jgi:hypothetical protein
MRAQIIINLPPREAEELDLTIQSLGFPSRSAYVMFLHYAHRTAVHLSEIERGILLQLGEWGPHNFKGKKTPNLSEFAELCHYTDENKIKKAFESLRLQKLVEEIPEIDGPFQCDVKIAEGKIYQLTRAGKVAARATLLLGARENGEQQEKLKVAHPDLVSEKNVTAVEKRKRESLSGRK